ncbi:MAG: four helix bundle protein [Anaerolineales bacterium]
MALTLKLMSVVRTSDYRSNYEAVGSVGANISEGYSRSSGKDRARFYEYALGPARESRVKIITTDDTFSAMKLRIIGCSSNSSDPIALDNYARRRSRTIREEEAEYKVDSQPSLETLLSKRHYPKGTRSTQYEV